jgi:hypothetical protein
MKSPALLGRSLDPLFRFGTDTGLSGLHHLPGHLPRGINMCFQQSQGQTV